MRIAAAMILAVSLGACATQPHGPTEAQKAAQDAAAHALADCANGNAKALDDHMSDAQTIALALHLRCAGQYQSYVDSYADPLAPAVAARVRAILYSEKEEVETFLPAVLNERKDR